MSPQKVEVLHGFAGTDVTERLHSQVCKKELQKGSQQK